MPISIQTLLPDIDMDPVKYMLMRGLGQMRNSFVEFSKRLDPDVDCTELEEAAVTLQIRWKDFVIALNNGADVTAWMRYKVWHEDVIKARAQGDSKITRGRSKRKRISTSLPPPRKMKHAFTSTN
jgi:hypothetical protein